MIEKELPHGNIEIPKHWNFPQRSNPDLEVKQIDLDQSFLAFNLRDDPIASTTPKYKGEYGDIFFDQEGIRLDRRLHKGFDTDIQLVREIQVSCWAHERGIYLTHPRDGDVSIAFLGHRTDSPFSLLGLADYKNTRLASVGLGGRFLDIKGAENYLISPWLELKGYSQEPLMGTDWSLIFLKNRQIINFLLCMTVQKHKQLFLIKIESKSSGLNGIYKDRFFLFLKLISQQAL